MSEYIEFLKQMVEAQKIQLEAVLSREIKLVEKNMSVLQTYLMKLDNMEKKRMDLQEQAGYADMTFKQIIENTPSEDRPEAQRMFDEMDRCVSEVSFYNKKSQEKVKLDLQLMGNSKMVSTASNVGGYTANKKAVDTDSRSLFEGKA